MSSERAAFIIAICGGTGSGKSCIAQRLVARLGEEAAAIVSHDWYYKPRRRQRSQDLRRINYDHPDSLDNALFVRHVRRLRGGKSVAAPVYDFCTHDRLRRTQPIPARPIIVLEGILLMAIPSLRPLLDLAVFVDCDAGIRLARRIRRDLRERGRDLDDVLRRYANEAQPMHEKFVEPFRSEADLVVNTSSDAGADGAADLLAAWARQRLRS